MRHKQTITNFFVFAFCDCPASWKIDYHERREEDGNGGRNLNQTIRKTGTQHRATSTVAIRDCGIKNRGSIVGASIIVAYLMRSEQKSLEEALESLKEISESACPNDGFHDQVRFVHDLLAAYELLECWLLSGTFCVVQLKLFEEMGFKVDTSSPLYKRFRLKLLGQSYKFGEKIGSYMFEDDPGLSPQSGSCQDSSKTEQHKTAYRCRKCRRLIAVEDNVISHVPGEGESCFDWNRRKSGRPYSNKEQDCSSLFVEPLKWMTPAVEDGALEGKLSCIHCGARLGYFNWSGIQCDCGSWVTPAFQIVKSKVDISTI
ncbi:hypothetical protein C2845_PM17G01110 [Panicum miliaceum]|uniref:protein-tyrosine-phosphatase n=1 Tax=Panicum miliaceum TaxID=4540 RepID=A0A3L6Q3C0_PANMI|nr:hypothetical protein C2845_PM17G01110 [Panicum miliaceum]